MESLIKFRNAWNYFLLYPNINYDTCSGKYSFKISKTRNFVYIALFSLSLSTISIVNWFNSDVKSHLNRILCLLTIANGYGSVFAFTKFNTDIAVFLTDIEEIGQQFRDENLSIGGKLSFTVIFFVVQTTLISIHSILATYLIIQYKPLGIRVLMIFLVICPCYLLSLQSHIFRIHTGRTISEFMEVTVRYVQFSEANFEVKNVQKISVQITSCCERLNGIFLCSYRLLCLYCTFYTLTMLYFSGMPYEKYDGDWIRYAIGAISVISHLGTVLYSIWTFEATRKNSKKAVEVIHDIQLRIGRKNLPYKSMELFLLNSKLNELKVSFDGIFTLDWRLIYSMVACISTYIVYLIQFREVEMQKSGL